MHEVWDEFSRPRPLGRKQIIEQIDALCALAKERQQQADPWLRGMRTSELEWFSEDEIKDWSYLHEELRKTEDDLATQCGLERLTGGEHA